MNHPVIPDNDCKKFYDPEHRDIDLDEWADNQLAHMAKHMEMEQAAYLKCKECEEEWFNKRLHHKKRSLSWRRIFIFLTVYFGLSNGGYWVNDHFPIIFSWIFPTIAFGFTLFVMRLRLGDCWLEYFLERNK
jgi:hypothetical protein